MYNFRFGRYNLEGLFGKVLDLWIWSAFHKAAYSFETFRLGLRILGTDIWMSKLSTASFAVTSAVCDGSVTHSTRFVYWSTTMRKRSNRYGTPHGSSRPIPPMGVQNSLRHPWSNISGNSPHDDPIPIDHPVRLLFGPLWWLGDDRSRLNRIASALNPFGGGGNEILLITMVSIPVEYFINVCELFLIKPVRVRRWPSKEQHTYPRFDSIHQLVKYYWKIRICCLFFSHIGERAAPAWWFLSHNSISDLCRYLFITIYRPNSCA